MSWSLRGVRAKIIRFNANLKALDDQFALYVASQPYIVVPKFEPETGWHSIRLHIRPPRPLISLIIGEAAHNLRSALDHLAWQLANLAGPPPRPKAVQFPIFSKPPKDFFKHPCVQGMRVEHQTVLEGLQPYHAGHGNTALEALAYINNTDKHQLLHTAATTGSQFVPHRLEARSGYSIEQATFGYSGLLEDDTEIGRILVLPRSEECQVNMEGRPSIGVAFGDPGSPVFGEPVDGLLKVVKDAVVGIVKVFDRPGRSGSPPWP